MARGAGVFVLRPLEEGHGPQRLTEASSTWAGGWDRIPRGGQAPPAWSGSLPPADSEASAQHRVGALEVGLGQTPLNPWKGKQ